MEGRTAVKESDLMTSKALKEADEDIFRLVLQNAALKALLKVNKIPLKIPKEDTKENRKLRELMYEEAQKYYGDKK